MKFPKIKHPLLCRIATYAVVLGACIVPMAAVVCIPAIPESVKAVVSIVCVLGLLVYLLRNFPVLMGLDIVLGVMQGYVKAYRQYPLHLDTEASEKRLSRFGVGCDAIGMQPKPHLLRFKSTAPITVYSSGIEKVVAVYRCGLLTKDEYHAIVNSGIANSQALTGKKKHLLLDKEQRSSPLNRVTVILILASAVEPGLSQKLYDLVCKREGDGFDNSVLPCVVDLSSESCVFNSPREPYIGTQYPVKNRGIRLIEKYIFGGRLPKGQGRLIQELEGYEPERTLWYIWHELKQEWKQDSCKTKSAFKKMTHGQISKKEDRILVKWEDRGVDWQIQWNEDGKTAEIEVCDIWDYPKVRPMSKKHFATVKDRVTAYFAQEGYTVRFVTLEEQE